MGFICSFSQAGGL